MTWHHVRATSVADLDFVGRLFLVNPFDIQDCVSQKQLPTVVSRKDYLFAILHFPHLLPEKRTVVPRQISIFLADHVLVTVYQEDLPALDPILAQCKDAAAAGELLGQGPGDLLWRILDVLVEDLFPLLAKLLEALEAVEDRVFDDRVSAAIPVNFLRRDIADHRRILFQMEGMIGEIRIKAKRYSRSDLDLHYEDLHDRVVNVWHTLESAMERVEIFKDADFILSTEKTNKILAVLTIMFTFSIPVTIVGALMGMNVVLPGGTEAGPWTFLGRYTTFWIALACSVVPTALMVYLFRRWRWI